MSMVIKSLFLFFGGMDEEGCNEGKKINMATRINSPEKVLFPGIIRWADVGRQTKSDEHRHKISICDNVYSHLSSNIRTCCH